MKMNISYLAHGWLVDSSVKHEMHNVILSGSYNSFRDSLLSYCADDLQNFEKYFKEALVKCLDFWFYCLQCSLFQAHR